jgi:hypothetical protein
MKAMYSVYDRNGDCFDFCDDEETEHTFPLTAFVSAEAMGELRVNWQSGCARTISHWGETYLKIHR